MRTLLISVSRVDVRCGFIANGTGEQGHAGKPVIYADNRHLTLFGPARSGKGVFIEIPNLLGAGSGWGRRGGSLSVLSIDPKAQNCAVIVNRRSRFSTVWVLNPLGVFGIPAIGFNPLLWLNPHSPRPIRPGIADALIVTGKNESQPHFAESTRALLIWLIMWVVIDCARRGRVPSLAHVRDLMTEPVEVAGPPGAEYEVKGLRATASRAVASTIRTFAGLAGRFVGKSEEIDGIVSTADTQTHWLMSEAMCEDISVRGDADFPGSRGSRSPATSACRRMNWRLSIRG